MLVKIRLFARLREVAGATELERTLAEPATVGDAWDALVREWPALAPYSGTVSCAVNEEYARLSATLADRDEIAFLPPVSGGAPRGEADTNPALTAD
jgi:molybdopterin converting factor subunit 1